MILTSHNPILCKKGICISHINSSLQIQSAAYTVHITNIHITLLFKIMYLMYYSFRMRFPYQYSTWAFEGNQIEVVPVTCIALASVRTTALFSSSDSCDNNCLGWLRNRESCGWTSALPRLVMIRRAVLSMLEGERCRKIREDESDFPWLYNEGAVVFDFKVYNHFMKYMYM